MVAKIIETTEGQLIQLPNEIRLDADEFCVKQIGQALLLYPSGAAWSLMESTLGRVDDDFAPRGPDDSEQDRSG